MAFEARALLRDKSAFNSMMRSSLLLGLPRIVALAHHAQMAHHAKGTFLPSAVLFDWKRLGRGDDNRVASVDSHGVELFHHRGRRPVALARDLCHQVWVHGQEILTVRKPAGCQYRRNVRVWDPTTRRALSA